MPVALTKKQTVVEAAPLPDDPLVAAVEFKRQSQAALTAKLEALQRAREGITSAEVHLEGSVALLPRRKKATLGLLPRTWIRVSTQRRPGIYQTPLAASGVPRQC